ncbi:MAG: cation transporter [Betaproteobacteria bacterium]|nr:cation transporter [Betaproteobacteria bacterium]
MPSSQNRAFAVGVALNSAFVLAEWLAGIFANSLALIADAGHNLSDVLGLLLAWGAAALAQRPPTARFTYGLRSSTILAALGNAAFLLLITGAIGWEAVQRFGNPQPVNQAMVIWVASAGVAINGATALLFLSGRKTDLNIRGAFLHMVADAAVSLGVVLAGLGMVATGWIWLDPAVGLVIAAVIVISTWSLLRESLELALHAVPKGVDAVEMRRWLSELEGVREVHDLHIWAMSTTETALTAHLVMPAGHPGDAFLANVARDIERLFRIGHVTLQVETARNPCVLAPDHVV